MSSTPDEGRPLAGWYAGLLGTAWIVPLVAGLATLATYIGGWTLGPASRGWTAILIGIDAAVAVWLGLALLVEPLTGPEAANRSSYGLLRSGLKQLRKRVFSLPKDDSGRVDTRPEVLGHLRYVAKLLKRPGVQWVTGYGYAEARQRLFRAEEALLLVLPEEELAREALRDELRLRDSTIEHADDLRGRLKPVLAFLLADLSGKPRSAGLLATRAALRSALGAQQAEPVPEVSLKEARIVVREVRRAIEEFREMNRLGLLRLRNLTLVTLAMAGLLTYLLLVLALVQGATPAAVATGVLFFLIAAVVGLVNEIYQREQTTTAVDSYGLTAARTVMTPVLSGLCGLGGVLLVGLGAGFVAVAVQINASAATQAASQPASPIPQIEQLFSLKVSPAGPLVAAVFGLTPAFFLGGVRQLARRYDDAVRSTQAGSGKSLAGE